MTLPRSRPSAHDVDARGILNLLDRAGEREFGWHSLMIACHGEVIAEGWWAPYSADRRHLYYSCSKSLTATAVGFLVDAGVVRLENPILRHVGLPDDRQISDSWLAVQVQHCLSMTLGHDVDGVAEFFAGGSRAAGTPVASDWLDVVLAHPPEHGPGEVFTYNQVATYLLARMVEHHAGRPLVEFLQERLLEPLGLDSLLTHTDPAGHALGFSGMHGTTEVLLALGQLYLDGGVWQGEQLLSPEWVARATERFGPLPREEEVAPDWNQGYGFSFWVHRHGYRADGAFGQFAVVVPEHDVVLAITAETLDMQGALEAIWELVLPACAGAGNAADDEELAQRLHSLGYPPLRSAADGPASVHFTRADEPVGEPGMPGGLTTNYRSATLASADAGWLLTVDREGAEIPIRIGDGEWAETPIDLFGNLLPIVASGGWTDERTFEAELRLILTPHSFRCTGTVDTAGSGTMSLQWRLTPLMGPDPLGLLVRDVSRETEVGL